ncbi:MAG: hypothetical protein AAF184_05550 [Pseudomonadota bacterium]
MSETTEERVMTLHPQGKQGVNIEKTKYDGMRAALLRVIPKDDEGVAFGDLKTLVEPHLDRQVFTADVSRGWYVTTVKQDLEARGEIVQVPRSRPQRLRRS